MDFKDWRTSPDKIETDPHPPPKPSEDHGKKYRDYIEEQIHQAQQRGEFDNLQGFGKPLNLDNNLYVGDNALGYRLLKSNGFAPPEIELAKEIRSDTERAEAKLAKLRHQRHTLRTRRVPPFPSEKRVFNTLVQKATAAYDRTLRDLNRKILTLNLTAPSTMHLPMFQVEKLVQQFCESCPPFE